jgi:hypothetical protein
MENYRKSLWEEATDWLLGEPVQWRALRRALTDRGYAIHEPYIVYKDCRVGKFEVNPHNNSVVICTHSKSKGYSQFYKVRDLDTALRKIRKSYINFLEASARPGAQVRQVVVKLPTPRQTVEAR